jgi:regulator of sirC expression with transglutaminase-like and TPR domain
MSRLAGLMREDGSDVALDEAALVVSAAFNPFIDEIEWLAALDALAADCPTPTADGVARYLFHDLGFTGNQQTYYDWRNSCLDHVIATRRGIPITLSVLMIEVARRIGVQLVGVGMPAHFLVRCADDTDAFFDPFHGSARLDRGAVRSLFGIVTGSQLPWNDGYLVPTPNREIVVRMLNNLKSSFVRDSDSLRLAIVMGLRGQVPELSEAEHGAISAATAMFN